MINAVEARQKVNKFIENNFDINAELTYILEKINEIAEQGGVELVIKYHPIYHRNDLYSNRYATELLLHKLRENEFYVNIGVGFWYGKYYLNISWIQFNENSKKN